MSNLVLGTAVGYGVTDLEPFVLSLRKYHLGSIGLVVTELPEDLDIFFKKYKVTPFVVHLDVRRSKPDIPSKRFGEYVKILETNFLDCEKIFLSDIRDVYFQADPFNHKMETDLEFFLEPEILKNCEYTRSNLSYSYGEDNIKQFDNNYVICSGTTFGTREAIVNYLKLLDAEIYRICELKGHMVEDQHVHDYLIYTNTFSSYKLYHTLQGPVATLRVQGTSGNFNNDGTFLNADGSVTPVVHQWDRLKKVTRNMVRTKIYNGTI
jgi:hypothetical protein